MDLHLYVRWEGQTAKERACQNGDLAGRFGYLREDTVFPPLVIPYLTAGAFRHMYHPVRVRAATLRRRLPNARLLQRQRIKLYGSDCPRLVLSNLTAFVRLCEQMEKKTGGPIELLVVID
jgi:hypothetical protein